MLSTPNRYCFSSSHYCHSCFSFCSHSFVVQSRTKELHKEQKETLEKAVSAERDRCTKAIEEAANTVRQLGDTYAQKANAAIEEVRPLLLSSSFSDFSHLSSVFFFSPFFRLSETLKPEWNSISTNGRQRFVETRWQWNSSSKLLNHSFRVFSISLRLLTLLLLLLQPCLLSLPSSLLQYPFLLSQAPCLSPLQYPLLPLLLHLPLLLLLLPLIQLQCLLPRITSPHLLSPWFNLRTLLNPFLLLDQVMVSNQQENPFPSPLFLLLPLLHPLVLQRMTLDSAVLRAFHRLLEEEHNLLPQSSIWFPKTPESAHLLSPYLSPPSLCRVKGGRMLEFF
jgi:hypothetical protein